ncbi:MAG: hypothetical protein A2900_03380 [Candidatus Chisholmbacteria bacterium RIFCSPLOWO2_01_FULL_50_28]|uniref:Spore protein YkvP/CgeB glycosyl transferase-like domain-containing protein n=1 Tax=Candidatus Chisholmbacteria bacterium RIFCSPHIGHO2_01_FULL_52_32 TaxID=1797591 RepID=A0A1G1VT25_9BACT|nr:MAG: hypothetical protein A2786_03365 [Candidatus Chisholmbacteria bacterium RIFCSPHIGHO2_01_FULL_52_32]OGY20119.1 MAG: hypothetical protein A2900_03380 [Candidatus Chisholmbacteria bacterium RIFCSPLOWO2_01_FULL_50_28]
MKIITVHTYYKPFLDSFYGRRDDRRLDYGKTRNALLKRQFGIGDAYSYNLRRMGHDAIDLIMNDTVLIRLWLRRNWESDLLKIADRLPNFLYRKVITRTNWLKYGLPMVAEEVRLQKPDIVLVRNVKLFPPEWIRKIKQATRIGVVGQIAYSFDKFAWLREYDLVISSLPNLVRYMEKRGIRARYMAHAFYKRILKKVKKQKKQHAVVFVGGFTTAHLDEIRVMEEIVRKVPMKIWGYGVKKLLPSTSPLMKYYQGEAWGLRMFNIYHNAKIVFNRHGDVAPVKKIYANNHRLFEATGAGAMLLTDAKDNLKEFFRVGREAVTYKDADDAVRKINYFLSHEGERKKIAKAGQIRTLKDHTYERRMEEFERIIRSTLMKDSQTKHRGRDYHH